MGHTPAATEAPVLGAQFASIGIAFISRATFDTNFFLEKSTLPNNQNILNSF